jgi:hypothetical protein
MDQLMIAALVEAHQLDSKRVAPRHAVERRPRFRRRQARRAA